MRGCWPLRTALHILNRRSFLTQIPSKRSLSTGESVCIFRMHLEIHAQRFHTRKFSTYHTGRDMVRGQDASALRRPLPTRVPAALLTCPVARAVEVHGEGAALVLRLPGGRGAVLVVGVGVVVVDVLAGEDGGARGAAHGRGHEGVGEVRPAPLHDAPGLVHHLHGTCNQSPGERPAGRAEPCAPVGHAGAEWFSTGRHTPLPACVGAHLEIPGDRRDYWHLRPARH